MSRRNIQSSQISLPPSRYVNRGNTPQPPLTNTNNTSSEILNQDKKFNLLYENVEKLIYSVQRLESKQDEQISALIKLTTQTHTMSQQTNITWTNSYLRKVLLPEVQYCVPKKSYMNGKIESCLILLLRGKQVSIDVEESARNKITKWLSDYRAGKVKNARKAARSYYWPPYGRPKLQTPDQVKQELILLNSDLIEDKAKTAGILGAIANMVWSSRMNIHDPTEEQRNWLKEEVCAFLEQHGKKMCMSKGAGSKGAESKGDSSEEGEGEDEDINKRYFTYN